MTSRPALHPLRHTMVAVVALASVAGGCDCGGAGIRDSEPRLVVNPESYDIEGVPGKFVELVLEASNEGSSVLKIDAVEILDEDGDAYNEFAIVQEFVDDCDNNARPEAGRYELQPGNCALLRFRYLPQGDGLDKGAIVIHSNDTENPELRVPINGNAQTPNLEVCAYDGDTEVGCSVTGAPFEVDFGAPARGTTVSRTLKLKSKGSRTLSIEEVTFTGDEDFTVTPLPYAKELEAGTEDELNVDFSPLIGGARDATLVITSNDPAEERLTVRLKAIGDGSKMCLCVTNQAGACRPTTVADFGRTPIGGTGAREMWITNCGNKPMELQGMEFVSGQPLFDATFPTLPKTLEPTDPKLVIPLTFSPEAAVRSEGRINLVTQEEEGFVTLTGEGYESGCKLVAGATVVDFGSAGVFPQNPATEKRVTFANQGDETCIIKMPNAQDPTDGVHISAGADVAFKVTGFPSSPVVPPATTVGFTLQYAPADLNGPDVGELTVPYAGDAPGASATALKVDLKGTPVADPVCVLTVAPAGGMFGATLNFGQVRVHTEKVLPATFTNVGSANCVLSNARIAGGGGLPGMPNDAPYFKVKNTPNGPILPGQSATVDVAFKPDSDRDYGMALPMGGAFPIGGVSLMVNTNDLVTFDGSDPLNGCTGGLMGGSGVPGCVKWGLSGSGAKSDLAALPGDIDFGLVTLGCRSREMTITVYNIGTIDTTITEILVDPAVSPAIFHVVAPPMPVTLTGGQQLQLTVRYRPPNEGIHTASVLIKSDATNATVTNPYITVGLRGEGTTETHQTDVFDQSNRPKSDVLFVIDDSGSMSEEQNALASNAQRFINVATSLNTDFQIGVITTDPDNKPGQLRGSPKIIANGPNAASDFSRTVRGLGTNGSGTEKGLQTMVDALSPPTITDPNINGGFLRSDAKLAVVVVSDEDDFSNGTVDFYTDFLKNIKGIHNQGLVTLSAIVGEPGGCSTATAGDRYIAVQQRTNGKFRSICSSDWGQIAGDLGLDAFGARAGFPLSRVAVPSTIQVKVNGQPSLQPEWSYDSPSNSVVFDAAHLPDAGAAVIIDYDAACL